LVFAKKPVVPRSSQSPISFLKFTVKKVSYVGALMTGILSCPAPYILMCAVLMQILTGWSLMFCLILGTGLSLSYLWFGGFKADVATDVFFGIMMILGFVIILPFLYMQYGGVDF
jgi:Na+/proline symporter